jgi:hypothetical protein
MNLYHGVLGVACLIYYVCPEARGEMSHFAGYLSIPGFQEEANPHCDQSGQRCSNGTESSNRRLQGRCHTGRARFRYAGSRRFALTETSGSCPPP